MDRNLVDIGNSNIKIIRLNKNELDLESFVSFNLNEINKVNFNTLPDFFVISSVNNDILTYFLLYLKIYKKQYKILDKIEVTKKLSFKFNLNEYKNIGIDRLLLMEGVKQKYDFKNFLLISLGTANTYNLVINNEFKGGIISPGIEKRLNSLENLLNISLKENLSIKPIKMFYRNTKLSSISGIYYSVLGEIEYIINQTIDKYNNIKIIFSGGGSLFFLDYIKNNNFLYDKYLIFWGIKKYL